MDRVKFCPSCDEVLPWDAATCKACGASVPQDPSAVEQVRARKDLELARLRHAASVQRAKPGTSGSPSPRSPTSKAVSLAVWSGLAAGAALGIAGPAWPRHSLLFALGCLLACTSSLATWWAVIHSAVHCALRRSQDG